MFENGQLLSHFKIIKLLGAGGMGEVYLAEDTKLQRKVALKVLLGEFLEDKERTERFQREARTAAQISHPNVMGIYDIGSAPDPATGIEFTYIVMEYIEGRSLTQHFGDKSNDLNEVIRIAEHIASGLAAAHKINVVHRDIKAGNIIIDKDGYPKILDFGLAKPVAPKAGADADTTDTISQELTQAGKIVGTVSYMSPEQIRGEAVDNRSDIFAFGILLYRMATGTAPFEGDTQVSTMAKILEVQPPAPRVKNELVPPELERIIDKCLKKNPEDRYQDTRDLVVDLRNLRRQYDSDISSNISSISGISQKKKATLALGLSGKALFIASFVVLVFIAVFWQMFGKSNNDQSGVALAGENGLAILAFENKTGDAELDWLQTGLPEILQTDLAENGSVTIIGSDRVMDRVAGDNPQSASGPTHEECLRAAGMLGAKHAISGALYKMGDRIRIDARVEDLATGKIVSAAKVVGNDPFILVDSLTTKIASVLNFESTATQGTDVAQVTSSSPEAYRIYHEGLQKFGLGFYNEAIEDFKQAISIDSTFALPYMRIGMAMVFTGRNTEGAQWFTQALKYIDKLPIRERNLLDVYADLWLKPNFDDAFTKMKTLVANYPDDREMRTLYAMMVNLFTQDTTVTFAHFDTVLTNSPRYLFGLAQRAIFEINLKLYDRALADAQAALRYYPESPTPYSLLGNIYREQKNFPKAIEMFSKQYEVYPEESDPLTALCRLSIFNRDFATAEKYVEKMKTDHGDDPYELNQYYDWKSGLAQWHGQFKKALAYDFEGLKAILKTGDSSLIAGAYSGISTLCDRLGMKDSSLEYSDDFYKWAGDFQKSDYPFQLLRGDPTLVDSARAIMAIAIKNFKERLPSEFWPLVDGLNEAFEGSAIGDTLSMIEGFQKVYDANPQNNHGMLRTIGILYCQIGEYQKSIDLIGNYLDDKTASSGGFTYPYTLYFVGRAYEGLGKKDKAKQAFTEMLKYWEKPDFELKEIKDAKKRLAAMTT